MYLNVAYVDLVKDKELLFRPLIQKEVVPKVKLPESDIEKVTTTNVVSNFATSVHDLSRFRQNKASIVNYDLLKVNLVIDELLR